MNRIENIFQNIAGAVKVIAFLLMVVVLAPPALIYRQIRPTDAFCFPMFFHKWLLRLLGMRVVVHGAPSTAAPVFFVSNHSSYLDIPVLGSLLPASFIAKAEVASWPLFGFLAKVQNTIFVERRSTRAVAQRTQLQDHLAQRKSLILFPEGTSSEGLSVLPFKSSLFSIVEDADNAAAVQPVSVTCIALDDFPILREDRSLYAWYGDMTLGGHLWTVFKRGHFTVEVIFHELLSPETFTNRKLLAAACQERVAKGIEQSLGSGLTRVT